MTHRDPLIVGLTGRAGAGKDTAAAYLVQRYGFVQVAFADTLRDMLAPFLDAVGVDHAVLSERYLKERPIAGLAGGVTPRRLLQTLGTEWGRAVHPDLWVHVLAHRIGLQGAAPIHDRFVVSDVRFGNEAHWVRSQGGLLLRLHRHEADAAPITHASEAHQGSIATWVHELIDNDGTLGQLHTALDGWCRTHGIDERDPVEA